MTKRNQSEELIKANTELVSENEVSDSINTKKTDKTLGNERKKLHDLFLQAPTSMGMLKGPDHIFEVVNPFYLQLIGKKDIIGKTVKEVLPEVEGQGFIEILDKVYATGEIYRANEMLIQLKEPVTGKLINNYLNFVYQPYRNSDGRIDGILFFAVDVTEQVISRRKVEESENRFRAIIEKSAEMITLSTKEGKLLYISPSITKVFGYELNELSQLSGFDFIHPDDLPEFTEKRQKILDTDGRFFTVQLRVLHKNGHWIWCYARLTNMLNEPGVHAMVSNFTDISEKKMAEQQMEFDKNNLYALINNTHDLLWSVDRNFKLLTFNRPFSDLVEFMSGVKLLKGEDSLSLVFPGKRIERYRKLYERAFAGEIFTEIEYTDSPVEFWSEISFYPIMKGNEIVGTACHSRNITERKRSEKKLLQSEKKYRQILETAQEGIWLVNEHNKTTFVNDKMCAILEYDKEEMMGRTNLSFNDEHEQKIGLARIERRKRGEKETYESKFTTKNDRHIWARVSASPIFDDHGFYAGTLAMVTDISKRKQEEQQLKLLESVITNTTDSVLITEAEPQDEPGPRIIYVNEAFTKMTGYTAEEVIGKTPRILQGPKSDKKELHRLGECLRKWEPCEITTINYKKNGEEFWINFTINPVANEKGWYTHWIAIERDVTEEKLHEHKIIKAIIKTQEDERYEIGGELHDNVCQLLATSQITLGMIKESIPEERMKFYTQSKEYIKMALNEIRNLSHRLAPAFIGDSTLEEAFGRLLDAFNVENKYTILFHFDVAIKKDVISKDIQLNLYRILQEQLKNILKYSKATIIEVAITINNNKLNMKVTDNGVGFDTNKAKDGIGLANMKRRTELFLGKFEIISSPGNGCIIVIDIPV
ncbi:PAS domain S-box protein [Ferruginibacter lapsinanis]|uniref:PAS domain S-box protein n=1 Tax=Ferruginibacter lapsinanis TaxID=563172 RepID=UPI001E354A4A|nr:PAS domain S-box protein [Ferruginibacter lapsinanis]UEG49291.1 PAS domain S-box protein [Ferruginibacter lapsinanis]